MVESAVRVALLARPGDARDQLRRALTELGATLVAEGDPSELDPGVVAGNSPTLVLVSLEPAIEASLDRFDALLATPGVEVMYDDAETTRQLDGWDLNRWARHLAAKLMGSDVLPPAPSGSDQLPETEFTPMPGLPPTPAQLMDGEKLEDYTQDAPDLADWVPTNPSLTNNATSVVATEAPVAADDLSLGLDLGDIELAMQGLEPPHAVIDDAPTSGATDIDDPAAALPVAEDDFSLNFESDADSGDSVDFESDATTAVSLEGPAFDATPSGAQDAVEDFTFEFDAGGSSAALEDEFMLASEAPPVTAADDYSDTGAGTLDGAAVDQSLLADLDFSAEPVRFSNFDSSSAAAGESLVDDDIAALSAQLDTFGAQDSHQEVKDPDFSLDFAVDEPAPTRGNTPEPARSDAPASASAIAAKMDFSNLSLLDEAADLGVASAPVEEKVVNAVNFELAPMDADVAYQEFAPGAVIILAGLGGPDAVRQMLASLPDKMPVPVLLYQHLEVGKHERLAEQLGKISKLPVVLAEDGTFAQPGKLFVLPAGMSATNEMRTLRFSMGPLADLFAALTPADSVVVMLSGADASLVPSAMQLLSAGGLAMAQDPDSCFDPVAAQMMARQGAPTYPALGLSQQIAERWSS
jgi:chemosensory pili system protein ChpB (putative protein-glutamate methylesterase)